MNQARPPESGRNPSLQLSNGPLPDTWRLGFLTQLSHSLPVRALLASGREQEAKDDKGQEVIPETHRMRWDLEKKKGLKGRISEAGT